MSSIALYNMERQKIGEIELEDAVFNAEIKEYLIHQALRTQLMNRRAGTVATKNRAAVAGSGKKPFKQKGTGNARQGCRRAPQYPGGGIVFGPQPKTYNVSMNKKARNAAICSALSLSLKQNQITVLDKLDLDSISTKQFVGFMKRFELERSLIVTDSPSTNLYLSARNVPHVKLLKTDALNIHDMLKYKNIVFTSSAVTSVQGVLAK